MLPKTSLLPRKRFRKAFYVMCVCTATSIALAIAPAVLGEAEYDASLAVLTATLIALVWTMYLNYQVVNNSPMTRLDFIPSYSKGPPSTLSLSVQNQVHNNVACLVKMEILTPSGAWKMPPPFRGEKSDEFALRPGEAFHGKVEDAAELVASVPGGRGLVLLTASGTWRDDTGEDGIIGPKSWLIGLNDQSMQRLYSDSEVEAAKAKVRAAS